MPHAMKRSPRAFTLVELLVVIGIISVLIALLFPTLNKARRQAETVKCAANLRSIGQALTMYTQQYGHYPGFAIRGPIYAAVWPVRLRPYTNGDHGVFHCPAQDQRFEWSKVTPEPGRSGRATVVHARYGYDVGEPLLDIHVRPFSYGYNSRGAASGYLDVGFVHRGLGGFVDYTPSEGSYYRHAREPRTSRVRSPSNMIAITDSLADGQDDLQIQSSVDPTYPRLPTPGGVHNRGANVLFCDGHVQWHLRKELLITYNTRIESEDAVRRMWNSDNRP